MRSLVSSTRSPGSRPGSKAAFFFLFFTTLLIGASAVFGQSALDGFDPNANSNVFAMVVQPDGKILIGGNLLGVSPNGGGLVSRAHLARLNPDGTLDTVFNPNVNFTVNDIVVQANGKILIIGAFTFVNGLSRKYIARLDPVTGAPDSFNPFPNNNVYSIALQRDGKILIGGTFSNIGGQPHNNIARFDPVTGAPDSFNPNADSAPESIIVQPDGKILLGGFFTNIGGQPRNRIARLDPETGLADSFNPNSNNEVLSIALQADGKVIVGGRFTSMSGQPRNRIARLDATTGVADSFNPNASSTVFAVAVQPDGGVLAGGAFANIGGQPRNRIARLDGLTGLADSFNPNASGGDPDGWVSTIAVQADSKVLAGGYFTNIGGGVRNHIARLETDGTIDRTLNLGMVGMVGEYGAVFANALQPDGRILLGGDFGTVLGSPRNNIARVSLNGSLDTAFDPNANNLVRAIAIQADGKLLLGGDFHGANSVGGQMRNYIARLDSINGSADSFDPNADGSVSAIAVQADGKVLASGGFSSIGGQARNYLARLDPTTGLADSFNPNSNGEVIPIAVQPNGKIVVGGLFTNIGGQARSYIARLDGTTGLADSFDPSANGSVESIAVQTDGKIVVSGNFSNIGGQTRNRIARLDGTTGLADSFDPNADQAPKSIAIQADGKILVGGVFATLSGQNRNYVARLDRLTGLPDFFDPNANSYVSSTAIARDGKILVGGSFTSISGQRRGFFARLTNDIPVLEDLLVSQTNVIWILDGSSPQFIRVSFDLSNDNVNYAPLGNGLPTGNNWTLTGLNLPTGQNFYIRARGFYRTGNFNGSESIMERVQNVFLPAPTGSPSPSPSPTATATATAPPTPTATATSTPTPNGTPTATPTPTCFLTQGFDNIATLPGEGWVQINHSTTVGTTGWFQGNGAVFGSQSGAAVSYIAANFNNNLHRNGGGPLLAVRPAFDLDGPPTPTPTPPNTISNWLLTPPLILQNGATMRFYTRTVDLPQFPDRMEVRMSLNGNSTNVGTTPFDVGDFMTLLLEINPTQTTNGYPNFWTQFTITLSGIPSATTGRLAFRYYVVNGGPNEPNGDYIGIDTVSFTGTCPPPPTPTPSPTASEAPATPTPTVTATATAPPPVGISGSVSDCANPVLAPVPGVTMTLSGAAGSSTTTSASGNYSFSGLLSGGNYTVTPTKAGLSPGAAGIDTVDVVIAQRHFLVIGAPLTGCRLVAADANGDGMVNTSDIIAIQRFFLIFSTGTANVGKYQFAPVNRSYSPLITNQTGQDYNTIVFGDVAPGFVH